MSVLVRNIDGLLAEALVDAFDKLKREVVLELETWAHADISSKADGTPDLVTGSAAVDLPTVLVLANSAKAVYNRHLNDTVGHKVADAAHVVSAAVAADQASANILLNAVKAAYELHRVSTTYHYTADSTNNVTAADATDLASSETLANDLKAKINGHINSAIKCPSLKVVAA